MPIRNLYFFWNMSPPPLNNVKKLQIWKRGTSLIVKAWGTISPGECSQGRWLRVCQTCVQGSHSFSIKHSSRRGSLFFKILADSHVGMLSHLYVNITLDSWNWVSHKSLCYKLWRLSKTKAGTWIRNVP